VHGMMARYGEAAAAVQEAVKHARQAKDARQQALMAFAYTQAALNGPTPVGEALEHCERLAAEGLNDRQSQALLLCTLARLRAMRGDFERGRELLRSARILLDDLGIIVLAASTAMHWARLELLGGDLDTAERELRQATETLTRLGERWLLPPTAALLAQVLYAQGRTDEAEQATRTAEEIADADDVEAQALWRSVRAKVLAGHDRFEEAEQLAREAVRLIRTTDASGWIADALLDLAEVLHRAGRGDQARVVAAEAKGIYEEKGNVIAAARAAAIIDSGES
jgi:ATP/maltotriose-dependent transcriptional regulator MalT